MPAPHPCYPVTELKQKIGQALPPEEQDSLARHLERCDRCASAVDHLLAQDTLCDALRPDATHPELPSGHVVEALIQRLRGLPLAAAGPGHVETTARSGVPSREVLQTAAAEQRDGPRPAAPAEPTAELYDFLAPAQGTDELGWLGGYRILEVLGAGGMGVVFLAEDPKLMRRVALKAMRPALAASASASKRFVREAQSMAAVEHDHVVRVYQVGEDRGVPFLAMELLNGEPLDRRLERDATPPLAETLRLGREMAEGLAAAHDCGLIHRDIKPGNVWLEGKRGRVKVLDFGLARAAAEPARLTQQGAIMGTPAYMAPEQAVGKPVDHRCDLFSLGCVLYRMTAGRPPFQKGDTISTLLAVSTEDPPPPQECNPAIPRALSDLVMRLLAKDPAERPASAQAVAEALSAIERETIQPAPAAANGPSRRPRRSWAVAAGLLALLAASVAAGVIIVRPGSGEGEFYVEVEDDSVAVALDKQGGLQLIDRKTGKEYHVHARKSQNLPAGEYELVVTDPKSDFEFSGREFTIPGKDTPASVRVRFKKHGAVASLPTPPTKGKAAALVGSPFDLLKREDISADALKAAGGGDPAKAPDGLVAVFDTKEQAKVFSLAVSPDGRRIYAAASGALSVWATARGQEAVEYRKGKSGWTAIVGKFALSPDGTFLVHYGDARNALTLHDAATGQELR